MKSVTLTSNIQTLLHVNRQPSIALQCTNTAFI